MFQFDWCKQEPDETVSERLWGLTEMFPERMRDIGGTVRQMATKGAYLGYRFSRSALWISVSTLAILVFPIMFESERIQLQEQQQMQQRQARQPCSQSGLFCYLLMDFALDPSWSRGSRTAVWWPVVHGWRPFIRSSWSHA